MKKIRFSEEQIIGILREHEAGAKVADLCRQHGMSPATLYKRKSKFGGMEVLDAKRLRALEAENAKLKRLVADLILERKLSRTCCQKSGEALGEAQRGGPYDGSATIESLSLLQIGRSCSFNHLLCFYSS